MEGLSQLSTPQIFQFLKVNLKIILPSLLEEPYFAIMFQIFTLKKKISSKITKFNFKGEQ